MASQPSDSLKQQEGLSLYREELEQVEAELASVEISLQELLDRQHELTSKRSELKAIIEQNESRHEVQKDLQFWNRTDFEWTKEIDSKLKSVFGLQELRPMQRQTMNATMSGTDCLLIMPTGGGKSLCFQLPAIIGKGLTLVVSPLVSLMEDQQMALEQLNVPSAILTASSTKAEQKFVLDDMVKQDGSLRLLYVTPEKLAKSKRFMNKLEKCYSVNHLSRLVIDEVHCCSQWGHDFRPDYKFLGIMKRQFPLTPILGLTATATTKVLEDVKKILNIPKALELKASFNRPNLFYEVREKPGTQKESIEAILSLIKGKFRNQSGIVYCFSRKESEEVSIELSNRGVEAGYYHADMEPKSRSLVHRRWLEGTLQVVVATIAFGMGIDKPDVRFVIHHSVSKSMENLYQESGRAGRDGNRSDCIVFYRLADVIRQSTMVFTEQTGLSNLHGIVKYCIDVSSCRRAVIARHFGEVWDWSQCAGMCDMCSRNSKGGSVEKRDITRHCTDVITILDAASSTEQRATAIKLVDAWYGKGPPGLKVKSIKPPSITRATAERILAHMLVHDFLNEDFHFTAYSTICYLVPGPKAKMIRNYMAKVLIEFPVPPSASKPKLSASSCSSSSSSTTKTTTPPSPLSRKESSSYPSNKPKLVVVNMEKSHFNSMSTPSLAATPSSSSTTSSSSNTSLKKSSSSSSSKTVTSSSLSSKCMSLPSYYLPSNSQKTKDDRCAAAPRRVPKVVIEDDSDDEGLNFDDVDDGIPVHRRSNSNRNKKQKISSSEKSHQHSMASSSSSTTSSSSKIALKKSSSSSSSSSSKTKSESSKRVADDKKNGDDSGSGNDNSDERNGSDFTNAGADQGATNKVRKRKRLIISSSSGDDDDENDDDDFQISNGKALRIKHLSVSTRKTGSRLSLGKQRKRDDKNNSIVITDDDDDDHDVYVDK